MCVWGGVSLLNFTIIRPAGSSCNQCDAERENFPFTLFISEETEEIELSDFDVARLLLAKTPAHTLLFSFMT